MQFEKSPEQASEELIKNGNQVCEIVSNVRGFKTDNKISLKTKLEKVFVNAPQLDFIKSCEK